MLIRWTTAAAVLAVSCAATTAFADDDPAPPVTAAGSGSAAPAPAPSQITTDRLVIPQHDLVLDAFLAIDLSRGHAGKPISITPDIWYGVTEDLTLGLVHSSAAATGILGDTGDAFCLSGKSGGCLDVYHGVGLDARYRLLAPLNIDAGVYIPNFDPFQLAIKVGLSGRWRFGKLALEAAPNVFFGIGHRDGATDANGVITAHPNYDTLNIPLTVSYDLLAKLQAALQLGFAIPFEHTGDYYRIPLTFALRYQALRQLGVGAYFTLTALGGGTYVPDGGDGRSLTFGGSYAF